MALALKNTVSQRSLVAGSRTFAPRIRPARTLPRRSAVTAGAVSEVNDDTFSELVLKSSTPVLVDFWAPWCGPCRMIAPIIDELAVEYKDKLKCVKLNTDESPNTATDYGIRSIPTVMVFKGGKKMDTIIGAVPKATLVQTVEKYL